jgi:hypothetical protein
MTSGIKPIFLARMTGLFLLLTILNAIFAQGFVSERLVDFNNAATTATNIRRSRHAAADEFSLCLCASVVIAGRDA